MKMPQSQNNATGQLLRGTENKGSVQNAESEEIND
jgi:hypothetical protein